MCLIVLEESSLKNLEDPGTCLGACEVAANSLQKHRDVSKAAVRQKRVETCCLSDGQAAVAAVTAVQAPSVELLCLCSTSPTFTASGQAVNNDAKTSSRSGLARQMPSVR